CAIVPISSKWGSVKRSSHQTLLIGGPSALPWPPGTSARTNRTLYFIDAAFCCWCRECHSGTDSSSSEYKVSSRTACVCVIVPISSKWGSVKRSSHQTLLIGGAVGASMAAEDVRPNKPDFVL